MAGGAAAGESFHYQRPRKREKERDEKVTFTFFVLSLSQSQKLGPFLRRPSVRRGHGIGIPAAAESTVSDDRQVIQK